MIKTFSQSYFVQEILGFCVFLPAYMQHDVKTNFIYGNNLQMPKPFSSIKLKYNSVYIQQNNKTKVNVHSTSFVNCQLKFFFFYIFLEFKCYLYFYYWPINHPILLLHRDIIYFRLNNVVISLNVIVFYGLLQFKTSERDVQPIIFFFMIKFAVETLDVKLFVM